MPIEVQIGPVFEVPRRTLGSQELFQKAVATNAAAAGCRRVGCGALGLDTAARKLLAMSARNCTSLAQASNARVTHRGTARRSAGMTLG